jgi:hypothetical protein
MLESWEWQMLSIGIDAHKRLHVAVAVDDAGRVVDRWRGPNSPDGWHSVEWVTRLGDARQWGIEGAWNYGRGLAQCLVAGGGGSLRDQSALDGGRPSDRQEPRQKRSARCAGDRLVGLARVWHAAPGDKYSPHGGEIRVSLRQAVDGITLTVCDSGIGLTPGAHDRIFEPFGRAPNATRQGLPGLGLGLHICLRIAEAHGGRMWAESEGEGLGVLVGLWLLPTSP